MEMMQKRISLKDEKQSTYSEYKSKIDSMIKRARDVKNSEKKSGENKVIKTKLKR
jgi:hypothetical protein